MYIYRYSYRYVLYLTIKKIFKLSDKIILIKIEYYEYIFINTFFVEIACKILVIPESASINI